MRRIKNLDSLLNDIEENCHPSIGSPECNGFGLDCLLLIRHKLPSIAAEGVNRVTEYVNGQGTPQSIADIQTNCWQYLKENHEHSPIHDPAVSAIRSVICLLSAQQNPDTHDIVDHLSFFLALLNNVEPHHRQQKILLRRYFAKCLS